MFVLSKVFWWVFNPSVLLFFLLVLGTCLLFTRWLRAGRLLVAGAMLVVTALSVFPLGAWMIETIENRFPANPVLPAQVDGIIVLGGTVNQRITKARRQPSLSEGSERLTEFLALARRHPSARLVFSGGSGAVFDTSLKEADVARQFLRQIGFDVSRVVFESDSRNTHENAVYTRRHMTPRDGETWILVTSALHMPRAYGVFRAAGWEVLPWPVDYLTDGEGEFSMGLRFPGGLVDLSTAMREWVGLFAYRILGRTRTLFPAPDPVPPVLKDN